ncbi:AbaSI family restriction endonuclease [Vagococcus zengguangii]|uniref:Uncharacterized protein n=1 Tax=Vagococcus zengguangii TaxID=2571750 RepID=A0A4D7CXM5_9ENTE|nr:hypothetical protein [Vagococcus zengguangii]QCI87231.1 hypothetical protein FA707_09945 [Vagococcus zengguangii]TLG80735.1 hypothetical protein FE258_04560 [Vagococcus zengguangii]
MNKVEYLAKTFSRTKRKDYENYVLNALWHKIDYLNIRPVTQQYVKGDDHSYYLIDLYFPQINLGVEVDEAFHKNNREKDIKRELTIEEKLSSIRDENRFQLLRIDATLPLEELTNRIEFIAKEIKQKIAEKEIMQWDTDISIQDQIKAKGYLSIDDFYRFKRIKDVANQLFFKDYKGYQKASFSVKTSNQLAKVWFPTISTKDKKEHSEWLNYLNEDWSIITENNIRKDEKVMDHSLGEIRIVFAKIKNNFGLFSYRYIGNFKLVEISEDNKLRIYKKVSDNLYINYDKKEIFL